jgi:disulfide bond formation protein DsbB
MKPIIDDEIIWMLKAARFCFFAVIICLLLALFFQFIAPIKLAMEIFYLLSALLGAGCAGALIEAWLEIVRLDGYNKYKY